MSKVVQLFTPRPVDGAPLHALPERNDPVIEALRDLARRFLREADEANREGDARWSNAMEHASDEVIALARELKK